MPDELLDEPPHVDQDWKVLDDGDYALGVHARERFHGWLERIPERFSPPPLDHAPSPARSDWTEDSMQTETGEEPGAFCNGQPAGYDFEDLTALAGGIEFDLVSRR